MAYADIYAAATDEQVFQRKCLVALWKAAQDIMNEDPLTQARADWASLVLRDKANITAKQLAMQVLRNSTIAADPVAAQDDAIQFAVNSFLPSIMQIG